MAPERDNFATHLDQLTPEEYAYVVERSYAANDKEAYEAAGYSKSSWYRVDEDRRDHLNGLAAQLKRDRVEEARRKLSDAVAESVDVLLEIMKKADSDATRLRAAENVINHVLGRPSQKVDMDVTSGGEPLLINIDK